MLLNAFPWYDLQLEPKKGFGMNHARKRETNPLIIYNINFIFLGYYEIAIFHCKPGYLSQFAHRTLQGLPDRLAMDYPHPLGFWFTEFGLSNQQGI